MTLGERCDEIVRLINETLGDLSPSETEASSPGRKSSTHVSPKRRPRVEAAS